MHLAQWNRKNGIPGGERSCDVYTCALGEDVCDHIAYLSTRNASAKMVHQVCKEAVEKRSAGYRNYISWGRERAWEKDKGMVTLLSQSRDFLVRA